jgi:ATP-dependent Clp protease protease subunit
MLLGGCVAYTGLEGPLASVRRPATDIVTWQRGPEAAKGLIFFCEQLDSIVAAEIAAKIVALDLMPEVQRIRLIINCPGGEVSSWRMISNAMCMTEKPVDVINVGNCYSAACAIFVAATGKRYAFPNSHFMVHRPQMLFDSPEHRQALDFEVRAFEQVLQTKTSLPADWFPLAIRPRYLDARQAMQYGLVDQIVERLP